MLLADNRRVPVSSKPHPNHPHPLLLWPLSTPLPSHKLHRLGRLGRRLHSPCLGALAHNPNNM